ncbi:hypothetical protein [Luteimonas viscosa]|uniref:hypothetical protein n=1 Tax=Luteimonas viscosa TaxID=1132694 RepID=UPI0016544B78|nr:hypothetical protein [Luteimonas viscosa]
MSFLAVALAVAVAVVVAVAVAFSSRKASRASQGGGAEERPVSERSEFGPRAPPSEKRRGPDWRSQSGSRPVEAVLVTFAKTKVTRATARKLLRLIFASGLQFASENENKQAEAERSVASRPSSF